VIDAAVAKPISKEVVKPLEVNYVGKVSEEVKEVEIGMSVKKSGRTTNLTFGKVVSIGAKLKVRGWGICWFVNQILFKVDKTKQKLPYPSMGGDSGSLLVEDSPENHPVGLCFAGGYIRNVGFVGVANPIKAVCDILKISFKPPTTPPTTKTPTPTPTVSPTPTITPPVTKVKIGKGKFMIKVKVYEKE